MKMTRCVMQGMVLAVSELCHRPGVTGRFPSVYLCVLLQVELGFGFVESDFCFTEEFWQGCGHRKPFVCPVGSVPPAATNGK